MDIPFGSRERCPVSSIPTTPGSRFQRRISHPTTTGYWASSYLVRMSTFIRTAAEQRMVYLRTFQIGKHNADSQKLLNEVAAAKVCLLNPAKKAAYDQQLRQQMQPGTQVPPPVRFEQHAPLRSGRRVDRLGHPSSGGRSIMPYTAEISRVNPTCFLFLVDQSGSMAERFGGESGKTKAQGVADAINRLFETLVTRCSKGDVHPRPLLHWGDRIRWRSFVLGDGLLTPR